MSKAGRTLEELRKFPQGIQVHQPNSHLGIRIHRVGANVDRLGRDVNPHWSLLTYGVIWITDGKGSFESGCTPRMECGKGNMFFLCPHVWQAYGPPPGQTWSEQFIIFSGPTATTLQAAGCISPEKPLWTPDYDPSCDFDEALLAVDRGDLHVVVEKLLFILSRCTLPSQAIGDQALIPELAAIAEVVSMDPGQEWNFHDLAAEHGLGYHAFRKQFRQQLGCAPTEFLLRKRVQLACDLLLQGLRVGEVAGLVGMPNPYYFSRQFKKVVGMPPRSFVAKFRASP